MLDVFPQIKIKSKDVVDLNRVKRLKKDLRTLKNDILYYAPPDFNSGKINRLRIRIFKFSRKERCNEFFTIDGNKKYVCINSSLLNKRYHAALLYTLHGISHSFSHFKDEIAEEAFCEYVCYSILKEFLKNKGKKFRRRTIRYLMKRSPKEYNKYYRAARKLDEKNEGIMLRMNNQSKNRKISKKKQRKIFYKLTKLSRIEDDPLDTPELEARFRKV